MIMKVIRIILIAMMLAAAMPATAQLRYGFRFGGIFSKPEISHADLSVSNGSGFSGGMMFEYQFEKCGFAPDIAILYTRYSNKLNSDAGNSMYQGPGKNFIEVPLHLKYKFWLSASKKLVAPMVFTGPSLMTGLDKNSPDLPGRKRFDAGWDVGVGIDIINFIQLQAGYRFGLTNAIATALPESASTKAAKLHLNGWTVAANIIFDF